MNILANFYRGSNGKLRILVSNIEIEGMVVTGADVTIISPKPWPASCLLQEVDIKFQELGLYLK